MLWTLALLLSLLDPAATCGSRALTPEAARLIDRLEGERRSQSVPRRIRFRLGTESLSPGKRTVPIELSETRFPWELFDQTWRHGADTYQVLNIGSRQKIEDHRILEGMLPQVESPSASAPTHVDIRLSGRKLHAERFLRRMQDAFLFDSIREFAKRRKTLEEREIRTLLQASYDVNEKFDTLILLKNPPSDLRERPLDASFVRLAKRHAVAAIRVSRSTRDVVHAGLVSPGEVTGDPALPDQPAILNRFLRDAPESERLSVENLVGDGSHSWAVIEQNVNLREDVPDAVQYALYLRAFEKGLVPPSSFSRESQDTIPRQFFFRADRAMRRLHAKFRAEFVAQPDEEHGIFTFERLTRHFSPYPGHPEPSLSPFLRFLQRQSQSVKREMTVSQ
jgi:hypothetical protein